MRCDAKYVVALHTGASKTNRERKREDCTSRIITCTVCYYTLHALVIPTSRRDANSRDKVNEKYVAFHAKRYLNVRTVSFVSRMSSIFAQLYRTSSSDSRRRAGWRDIGGGGERCPRREHRKRFSISLNLAAVG